MSLQKLFPHLRGFRLLAFQREPQRVVLTCERGTRAALCPVCCGLARRIHSRYQRTVWDLPLYKQAAPPMGVPRCPICNAASSHCRWWWATAPRLTRATSSHCWRAIRM